MDRWRHRVEKEVSLGSFQSSRVPQSRRANAQRSAPGSLQGGWARRGNDDPWGWFCDGTGELERLLLARWPGLPVVGMDLSLEMLRQASAKKENRGASWVQAEASRLPFADAAFDSVICANSFHYFHSPRMALQEAHRVLRPHGLFVLLDWCDDYLSCKLCSLWLRLTDPAFCRTYTVGACRALLEEAGFEVIRSELFRVRWIWGMMRFTCRRKRGC
jgi:SAM-dependent methyltransferase